MIIYKDDKNLILTAIGDINKKPELLSLLINAESFRAEENRFFKINSKDTITRSIKFPTRESMTKEIRKKFRESTNTYDSHEYYDKEHNIGYKAFPYMKKPAIYSYSLVYPAITEFFKYWKKFNYTENYKREFLPKYDLSKLFDSMKNFKDLETIFTKEQGELLKKTLYEEFPEFAIFYYEIYPYLNIETIAHYDISKLINARMQIQELGLDTTQLDSMLENLEIAENNGKVLKLIRKNKVN